MRTLRALRPLICLAIALIVPAGSAVAQTPARSSGGASRNLIVDVLDIGQGDSVLIRAPEGKVALIDAGPSKDAAARALKAKGITGVDLVIVSHHHSDHYGGMDQVVRDFKPRFFMATGSSHTTKNYLKLLETVKSEGVKVVEPTSKPRKIELGSVVLTVLPQPEEDTKEENDNSIGVRLQFGDFSMLMTGDSETDERRWWLENCPDLVRECTILKLAHHGSRNGTDQEWVDLVQPEIAVASLASGNDYGHPHSETISLLRDNVIPLLRTDQRGTITIVSNGRTWNMVKPSLARRRAPQDGDSDTVASATTDDRDAGSRPPSRSSRSKSRWR